MCERRTSVITVAYNGRGMPSWKAEGSSSWKDLVCRSNATSLRTASMTG